VQEVNSLCTYSLRAEYCIVCSLHTIQPSINYFVTAVSEKLQSAAVGDKVHLHCEPTVSGHVNWNYQVSSDALEQEIVANGHLLNSNDKRFEYDGANLTIKEATQNYSGFYICVENSGFGDRHVIQLIVIGKFLCPFEAVLKATCTSDQVIHAHMNAIYKCYHKLQIISIRFPGILTMQV